MLRSLVSCVPQFCFFLTLLCGTQSSIVRNISYYLLLGISLLTKSLSVDLYNLLTDNDLPDISKSAYSQARYKIKFQIYQVLNIYLLAMIYDSKKESSLDVRSSDLALKKWKGYFLEAIDGTGLILPQTKALGSYFGYNKSGTKTKKGIKKVMAKCLVRVDLLNEYVLQSEVFKASGSERTICKKWLYQLNSESITIFDRGFGSASLFFYSVTYNKPIVARLSISFNKVVKEFMASDSTDSEVYFKVNAAETFTLSTRQDATLLVIDKECICIEKESRVKIRLVKVLLSSGEVEILATNLMDKKAITLLDLSQLYNKRWGVETIIDSLKNQLLLMVFSGLKPAAILQDLYASFFVYNLRQIFINESQQIVNQQVEEKEKPQNEQKVNKNVAIGILKWKIIILFLLENPEQIIVELVVVFAQNKIPKVENKEKPPRNKSLAKRRNLVTQKNYRKAI
jgi:hypothetical protein